MKKILFLINTLQSGGAEKILVDTVNNLPEKEWDITVYTVVDKGEYVKKLNKNIKYKSMIKIKSKLVSRIFLTLFIKIIPEKLIYNFFVDEIYDYEIAFLEGMATKILSASTNKESKKIAWVHTDLVEYPDSFKVFGSENNEKKAYSKYDAIACVSEGVKEKFLKKYGRVTSIVETVYNVVDEADIIKKSKERCLKNASIPIIISVGRLTEQKGYECLLRVIKRINEEKLNCVLLIVGEGEQRKKLEEYIEKNKLHNVELLGFQENPYKFLARADVFVSSSIVEGFSTVITEAVVLGIPVISTNTAGANEPLNNPRCSVIVDTEDELYCAIKRVLEDPQFLELLKEKAKGKRACFSKEFIIND